MARLCAGADSVKCAEIHEKWPSIHIYLSPNAPKTLVIEDTGIGIAPEDLPRIFEKGYTGCNGRADKRSTGIGLYLCRQIMEKLSHTIRIESEMGVGNEGVSWAGYRIPVVHRELRRESYRNVRLPVFL